VVALVVPTAEALFDFLDETGEVAEAVFEAVEFLLGGGFVAEVLGVERVYFNFNLNSGLP
jgi:hypothetical protein